MKTLFKSKSAQRCKKQVASFEETKKLVLSRAFPKIPVVSGEIQVVKISTNDNLIAWLGTKVPKVDSYGFKNVDIENLDSSIVVKARLLVISYVVYTNKVSSIINLAYEYGIPILWVGAVRPPKDKIWLFKDFSNMICWELICQLAR